jgi:hypothetical protein
VPVSSARGGAGVAEESIDLSKGTGAIVTLQQAITELATLADGKSHFIDMEYASYATGNANLEWTVTVKMGDEASSYERWSAPTLDEAMSAARAALRTLDAAKMIEAADAALA